MRSALSRAGFLVPRGGGRYGSLNNSGGGGGGGTVEAGHLWLTSITSAQWAAYQVHRTNAQAVATGGRTKVDLQALFNALPSSAGTTLSGGVNETQINNALAANSVVALQPTTYSLNGTVTIPAGKALICLGATNAICDFYGHSGAAGTRHGFRWMAGSVGMRVTSFRAPNFGSWVSGNGCFWYKCGVSQAGFEPTDHTWIGWYSDPSVFDSGVLSCEALNTMGGGEGDGFKLGAFFGGNTSYGDCWANENDDDGFDIWSGNASNDYWMCGANRQGKNTAYTQSQLSDGNGYKLGGPTGSLLRNYLTDCGANNNGNVGNPNGGWGFNYNGAAAYAPNATPPVDARQYLRRGTGSGNQQGLYAFGSADPLQYVILN